MAKKSVDIKTSEKEVLEKMGSNIKRARLRRNISAANLAKQAGISADTLSNIEKGATTVSIGAYVSVLAVLELERDLEDIARDEEGKKAFGKEIFKRRERASKRK